MATNLPPEAQAEDRGPRMQDIREAMRRGKRSESKRAIEKTRQDTDELRDSIDMKIVGGRMNAEAIRWQIMLKQKKVPAQMAAEGIKVSNIAFQKLQVLRNNLKQWNDESGNEQPTDDHGAKYSKRSTKNTYRDYYREIDSILKYAQNQGVIMYHEESGRIANYIGLAEQSIRRLENAERGLRDIHADRRGKKLLEVIKEAKQFFGEVLRGDPYWRQVYKALKKPELNRAYKQYFGTLRMLAVIGATAMMTISGLLDLKNKRLSPYTLIWLGISSGSAGLLKGRAEKVVKEMQFIKDAPWKRLQLSGAADARFLEIIRTSVRNSKGTKVDKELRKAVKSFRDVPSESGRREVCRLLKERCKDEDVNVRSRIATHLNALNVEQLNYLIQRTTGIDDDGFGLLYEFVNRGINQHTVMQELRATDATNIINASTQNTAPASTPAPQRTPTPAVNPPPPSPQTP